MIQLMIVCAVMSAVAIHSPLPTDV